MLLERETARLLGKIAFLGLWQGRFKESEAIFRALEQMDMSRIGPLLGQGMALAHQGRYDEAATMLRSRALALDPEDDHARAWYGLVLHKGGHDDQARPELERVAASGKAEDAVALAKGILEEMDGPRRAPGGAL